MLGKVFGDAKAWGKCLVMPQIGEIFGDAKDWGKSVVMLKTGESLW